MKKILCIFLSFIILFAALFVPASAAQLAWSIDENGTLTVSGTGAMEDYYPSAAPWYALHKEIKAVVIADGVTSVGSNAFYGCTQLESVTFGNQVTAIGNSAFELCSAIETIVLPDRIKEIGNAAFRDCAALRKISIPGGVTIIQRAAFQNCRNLSAVSLTAIENIEAFAFSSCDSLEVVAMPTSLASVGEYAFYGCKNLQSVFIPQNVTAIGKQAFAFCPALSVLRVDSANAYYAAQDNVLFNKEKTQLLCFAAGNAEQAYSIPESVNAVAAYAFTATAALRNLHIPAGVTQLHDYAFADCNSLAGITVDAANPTLSAADGVLYDKEQTRIICYPPAKAEAAFSIPATVTSLSDNTFADCVHLKALKLAAATQTFSELAVSGKTKLTAFEADEQNQWFSAKNGVLYNKSGNELIRYPAGKADAAFEIPASVKKLSASAFADCAYLKTVSFAADSPVEKLDNAFSNCGSLQEIVLPAKLAYNEQIITQFDNCSSLTSLSFNGESLYYTVNDGLLFEKNMNVFFGCLPGLRKTAILLPVSVTSVAAFAGRSFTTLTDIYYEGTEEQWNAVAIGIDNDYITNANVHFSHTHRLNKGTFLAADNDAIKLLYTCTDCGFKEEKTVSKPEQGFLETQQLLCDAQNNLLLVHPALSAAAVLQLTAAEAVLLDADENIAGDAAVLATGMTVVTADQVRYTVCVRGDIDCNGTIESGDARLALRCAVGLASPATNAAAAAADIDRDATLSAADARLILRYCVGLYDAAWTE